MSAVPVMLEGTALRALVVGGGAVATRRALALLDAGAAVHVVAPTVTPALRAAAVSRSLRIDERAYESGDIGDAVLVLAATSDRATNARVSADARARSRLVVVADAPGEGNCIMAAAHRAGPVVVGVAAGGVPGAASRIRDAIGVHIDTRYGDAVEQLADVRRRLLAGADGGAAWREMSAALLGDRFCTDVEQGTFSERLAAWR